MTIDPKKGVVIALVICAVLAAGTLVYVKSQSGSEATTVIPENPSPAPSPTPAVEANNSQAEVPGTATKTETPAPKVTPPTASIRPPYDTILAQYRDSGYRFQISDCHGNPGKMNIKQGTKFMVDNRDKDAHTFKLASVSREVPGYDYEIFTAPKYGNYFLTCDGKGAAELQVYP